MAEPGTHKILSPNAKLMQEVYKDFLRIDSACLAQNHKDVELFRSLARKYLANKAQYDQCQQILDLLIEERELLKKDVEYDRQKLGAGSKARGDGVRFRMEQDKAEDRDARDRDSDPAETINDALWAAQTGNDDSGGEDEPG